METVRTSLLEWERAEIERSDLQARLTVDPPKRTSPGVLARYANPPGDTVYSWEYAFHLLGDARGARVLDLGCGDGKCTTLVASHGGTVTALDISTELLAIARVRSQLDGNTQAVSPLCASIHSIPLASESFDVVFGMAVLHHVDLELAAREVHRVLKPGGRAIFCEPVRNSKTIAALRRLVPYRQPDVSPFERPLRWDEIESFSSRFSSLDWREFNLPHVQILGALKVRPSWQDKAYALDARILRRWPRLRRYASVVVFQVRK